jgi:hypothetical protein
MTTTTKYRDRVIALRELARKASTEAEADTALAMARKLCVKHGIDVAILDAKAEPQRVADPYTGGTFQKKYPCRFGCSPYTQHTIEELNECAAKARANGSTGYTQQKAQRDPFDDMFRDFFRNQGQSRSSTSSDGREHKARATGSHAYCSHEATKSARAKCRRERGY